jgi:hypothetical protein
VAGPGWLSGILAAAMLLTAVYCATRLIAGRLWRRSTEYDVDAVHVLMGVAMAGMLVPALNPLWFSAWQVVFAVAAGWFATQAIRAHRTRRSRPGQGDPGPGHHIAHVLSCGTMLYMLLAAGSATAAGPQRLAELPAGAMAATHPPALALILAVVMAGYVVWTTDRLTALASPKAALAAAAIRAPSMIAVDSRSPEATDPPRSCGPGLSAAQPGRLPLSPRLAACCQIAMGITMGYMLIQTL